MSVDYSPRQFRTFYRWHQVVTVLVIAVDMMGSADGAAEGPSGAPLVLHLEAPDGECK